MSNYYFAAALVAVAIAWALKGRLYALTKGAGAKLAGVFSTSQKAPENPVGAVFAAEAALVALLPKDKGERVSAIVGECKLCEFRHGG